MKRSFPWARFFFSLDLCFFGLARVGLETRGRGGVGGVHFILFNSPLKRWKNTWFEKINLGWNNLIYVEIILTKKQIDLQPLYSLL